MFYGAGLAYVQKNAKRLIAASSISQMGIPLLGLSSMNLVGINGAIYHMIAHGIIAAGLFTVVGILKNRFKTEATHSQKELPFSDSMVTLGSRNGKYSPPLGAVSSFKVR